jgi:ATP-dependent RNA helicase DDX24/MAK5
MSTRPPLKRKAKPNTKSRKKAKVSTASLVDSLPWKSVAHLRTASSLEDDDCILGLEEVDNVQVIYEDTSDGRVVKFNVSMYSFRSFHELTMVASLLEMRERRISRTIPRKTLKTPSQSKFRKRTQLRVRGRQISAISMLTLFLKARKLLPNWNRFNLHPQLLRALHNQNFTTPTPIQSSALPPALIKKDLVGIAETVSFSLTQRLNNLLTFLRAPVKPLHMDSPYFINSF